MPTRAFRFSILAAMLIALLQACATNGSQPRTLEARAQARWDAMLAGDLATAYEYYSPGYRSVVALPQFERLMLRRTVKWTGAEYQSRSDCTEVSCKVQVALHYRVSARLPGTEPFDGVRIVHEDWINLENQWFFVPKQ